MSPPTSAAVERLPLRTKLAFGVGSSAEAIAIYAVLTYALLFYNQVKGVPAHWVGLAISASLVFDGLTEPIVGSWSDRTKSKLGRRHPWMYAAPIPIALSFYAIFAPPEGLSSLQLAIWCGVSVTVMRQVMSFFHTPHLALGAELSPHYTERSKVMAYNSFFTWAGASAMSWIALSYFFPRTAEHRNGLLNPEPWPTFALVFALAIVVILFASAWFTRDRIPLLPKAPADARPFSPVEFASDVWKALRNINYVWLLVGYFFLSLMIGLRESLRMHANSFYWELETTELRWFVAGSFVGYLTAFMFAARMHGRYDKKRTAIVACIVYAVVPAIPLSLGMLGVLTPQTPNLLPILIAFAAVAYGAVSILQISVMSMLADIADENELRFGVRQEGILYSTRALSAKIDQAIGSAAAGFVLLLIAFPEKAKPGSVAPDILYQLALWDGLIAAAPGVIAAFCYGRYRINRATYEATRAALAEKRAKARAAADPGRPAPEGGAAPVPAE
jgi:glycoside/pentoside/hexuronide:cation symporter, GPH family